MDSGPGSFTEGSSTPCLFQNDSTSAAPPCQGGRAPPESIDVVLFTHLHRDHAAGSTRFVGTEIQPAFPNARYRVQRGEWLAAANPTPLDRASYLASHLDPVAEAGLVDLLDGDAEVAPGVTVEVTGGHTAGHQMVWVRDGGQALVYPGDVVPTAAHLAPAAITAYDLDRPATLEAKRRLIERAADRDVVVAWTHDPRTPAARLRNSGRGAEALAPDADELGP